VRYDEEKKQYYFDFEKLASIASLITRNLDKVIDKSFYPIKEARNSNLRHRPIGIGDMGLADVFQIMGFAYDSQEAKKLNVEIAETVYYACMKASMEMAREYGKYSTFDQSPLSQGIFQFDMWGRKPSGDRYDWESLRKQVMQYGVRNSLLRALMPTASTSQIMGQTESFEPLTSNLYVRRTQAGEFIVINPNLVKELTRCNLWVPQIISQLVKERGSVQKIEEIPQRIKDIYKTVWEISLKVQIDMSADRGAFICQSQSFNVHMENPTVDRLTSMLFYAWSAGLKTGCYYLKTKPAVEAIQFTVDSISKEIIIGSTLEKKECDGSETCLMCQ
jgi:ribonucleoside-diphosphate reductase alpha chain